MKIGIFVIHGSDSVQLLWAVPGAATPCTTHFELLCAPSLPAVDVRGPVVVENEPVKVETAAANLKFQTFSVLI
jgi:hypothetical protein